MQQNAWPMAAGMADRMADGMTDAGTAAGLSPWSDGALVAAIRLVLADCGGLGVDPARLAAEDDLYTAGLTSHGCVGLMLGLEERFDVEFPERLLNRRTFESIAAIREALRGLVAADPIADPIADPMNGGPA